MRKFGFIALTVLALTACSGNGEKEAALKLQAAEEAYAQGKYSEAKLQLDSIKILYPKAFEARRKGISLMEQVEIKEQERSVVYLDSVLKIKQAEADLKKKGLVLEKNAEYQTVGNYLHPSQTVEKISVVPTCVLRLVKPVCLHLLPFITEVPVSIIVPFV
jgi:hypothetical protein